MLLAFMFCGCEHDKDPVYFEDLTPPEAVVMDINLDGIESGETIFIYRKTKIHYDSKLPDRTILKYDIKLGDKDLYISEDGVFYLDPWDYRNIDELELTIDVALKTGTNSIAEHLGLERYLGTFNYKIKFMHNADLSLKFNNSITDDGALKVSWNPLTLEQLKVIKYEVYRMGRTNFDEKLIASITDISQCYFIDKQHVLGKADYLILTYFEDDRIDELWDYHTVQIEYPSGDLYSKPIGLDKMKIWWKKHPYNCYYALELEDGTLIDCKDKTELEISHNYSFPISKGIKLYMYPVDFVGDIKLSTYSLQSLWSNYIDKISLSGEMEFDVRHHELYVKDLENLFVVDMNTMQIVPNRSINTSYDWGWNQISMHYSNYYEKLFYLKLGQIIVYNRNLEKISQINAVEDEIKSYAVLQAATSGRLIAGYRDYSDFRLYVYDIASGRLLYSEILSIIYLYRKVSSSKYGTYLCFNESNYIEMYGFNNIEMYEVNAISTYPKNFEACIFSKFDDETLFVVEKEQFYTINVLTKSQSTPIVGRFMTEDPFTGNVAYLKNEENTLVIFNTAMGKEIYSIPVSRTWNLRLFNNILTTDKSGNLFFLDLTPYIN